MQKIVVAVMCESIPAESIPHLHRAKLGHLIHDESQRAGQLIVFRPTEHLQKKNASRLELTRTL